MGKFGGPSPKRHLLWSNDEMFVRQVMARGGYLSNAEKDLLRTRLAKTRTRHGKTTFHGVKKKLKESQPLCCSVCMQCASFFCSVALASSFYVWVPQAIHSCLWTLCGRCLSQSAGCCSFKSGHV